MCRLLLLMLPIVLIAGRSGFAAEIVCENARIRAVLGADACWKSLVDKQTGRERLANKKISFAMATIDGKARIANSATMVDDKLNVGLGAARPSSPTR